MSEEAEEKKLPASDKKLRDARRKGQVAQSRDLISGFTLLAALAYLYFIAPAAGAHLDQYIRTVTDSIRLPFSEAVEQVLPATAYALFLMLAPLAGIIALTTVIFGMIATAGPVFSFEPVKPQFEHISPAKGLKKIVSLRNVIEFVKGLAKVVMLSVVFVAVLLAWLQPLFHTPACGQSCTVPTIVSILTPLAIAAALSFLIIGLIDVPIQRWLFRRDMRMTRTEYKREHKDIEGDPLIRQELNRRRRDSVGNTVKIGLRNAVLVIAGPDQLVALRYVQDETPVPAVVAKGQGRMATEMMAEARRSGIPVADDPGLAAALFESVRTGEFIEDEFFPRVVDHMVRSRYG